MKSLSINEGLQSFMVNDDPTRIVRFNPADPNLLPRLLNLEKRFSGYNPEQNLELNPDGTSKSGMEKDAAYIEEFSNVMSAAINEVFNANIYDTIFNGQSPLCIVGGKYLFEEVLDSLIVVLDEEIKAYNAKNAGKMKKYLGDIKRDR